jgi:hypothetical protein
VIRSPSDADRWVYVRSRTAYKWMHTYIYVCVYVYILIYCIHSLSDRINESPNAPLPLIINNPSLPTRRPLRRPLTGVGARCPVMRLYCIQTFIRVCVCAEWAFNVATRGSERQRFDNSAVKRTRRKRKWWRKCRERRI